MDLQKNFMNQNDEPSFAVKWIVNYELKKTISKAFFYEESLLGGESKDWDE